MSSTYPLRSNRSSLRWWDAPDAGLAWCDRGAVAFAATAVPARAIATKSPAATARTRLPERMLSLFPVGNKAAFYFSAMAFWH